MTVAVRLVGTLSGNPDTRGFSFSLSSETNLLSLLRELEDSRVQKGSLLAWNGHSPRAKILILVNGVEASVLEGLQSRLNDGDTVTLIPVSHGG
jgi:molybdopterin converting factor small subunit